MARLLDRAKMALSLGVHMVLGVSGIAMPLRMLIAEGLWLRTDRPHYRDLARKWAKAIGLLFALGAVSGTALSFEFGSLWPRFMKLAGSIIGTAFALEGLFRVFRARRRRTLSPCRAPGTVGHSSVSGQ
jgi:cytochrome d ubiquinol oxidase subunit I